jgi:hypothetical protein
MGWFLDGLIARANQFFGKGKAQTAADPNSIFKNSTAAFGCIFNRDFYQQ